MARTYRESMCTNLILQANLAPCSFRNARLVGRKERCHDRKVEKLMNKNVNSSLLQKPSKCNIYANLIKPFSVPYKHVFLFAISSNWDTFFFFPLICLPSIYFFKTRLKGLSPVEIFLTQSASNDPSILFTQHIGHYSPSSVTHCTFLQLCFVSLFPLLDSGNKKVRVVYFISVFLVLGERYTCNQHLPW